MNSESAASGKQVMSEGFNNDCQASGVAHLSPRLVWISADIDSFSALVSLLSSRLSLPSICSIAHTSSPRASPSRWVLLPVQSPSPKLQ
ncbi:hypothetical protein K443DRAFT_665988 [Laccaria amethystina LaAM-08-1]|uniref:Uncharacterized protein n=1 Tax=Laccaria amethystina LaAM-08-1 TaxID=1095629 RepID=A0A0C9XWZ9_9AGAR|nr:hypothetical protein K443DRAFT_665988 [Laccaria amethystina LaAM-08-1]